MIARRIKPPASRRRHAVFAALISCGVAFPAAAAPVRVDFVGVVSPEEPEGPTHPGNVFGVNGGDTYTGYVEFDLDLLTSRFLNTPLHTNAEDKSIVVEFGPDEDPSVKFRLSLDGQERFTEQNLNAGAFNEPKLTFAVRANIDRMDPDGPDGPERPFDVVSYEPLNQVYLAGVTVQSEDPITISSSDFFLLMGNTPSVTCVGRRGESGKDCRVTGGVSGEIANDTIGRPEVGLEVLTHSGADLTIAVPQVDGDGDGVFDYLDNCPQDHNSGQENSDNSGPGDACDPNDDHDLLTDAEELQLGTNPLLEDTDSDGLYDGIEVQKHGTNPLLPDSDGDNLTDTAELQQHGTNPLAADTDGDGTNDDVEIQSGRNPNLNEPLVVSVILNSILLDD